MTFSLFLQAHQRVLFVYLEHIVSKMVTFSVWKVVQRLSEADPSFQSVKGAEFLQQHT